MSLTLCVDPGIRGCGVSLYSAVQKTGVSGAYIEAAVPPYLKAAAYIKNPVPKGSDLTAIREMARAVVDWAPSVQGLVVEWPQINAGRQRGKKDPNDLPPLAGIDATLFTLLKPRTVGQYLPREWKGTVDPDEMIRRIKGRLSAAEFQQAVQGLPAGKEGCTCAQHLAMAACTSTTCKWHNVFDAIGIGLKYFGRLEKARVIHR